MAGAAVAWPIVIAGIAFPSFATFLLGLVTVPEWLHPWVRLGMLVLAVILPLIAGFLSSRLPDEGARPRGRDLVGTIARGYPNSLALFVVIVWMMFVAPLGRIRALIKRWESVHVPIAVKPGGYNVVLNEIAGALSRAGGAVRRRRAAWECGVSGRGLALSGCC